MVVASAFDLLVQKIASVAAAPGDARRIHVDCGLTKSYKGKWYKKSDKLAISKLISILKSFTPLFTSNYGFTNRFVRPFIR